MSTPQNDGGPGWGIRGRRDAGKALLLGSARQRNAISCGLQLLRTSLSKCWLCRFLCGDQFFNRYGSLLIDALTVRAEKAEAEVKRLQKEVGRGA